MRYKIGFSRLLCAIRHTLAAVLAAVFVLDAAGACAVTVLITNTADSAVNAEYDHEKCSVEVNEQTSDEEGVRRFEIGVHVKDGYHKHEFVLTTTSGIIEKISDGTYMLTVRGGEAPVVKVTGLDRDPSAVVRVSPADNEATVISRDSACETGFRFFDVRPGEYRSAVLLSEPALPSGTEITMKTEGKWYRCRVDGAADKVSLASFSALDGSGAYKLPEDGEPRELYYLVYYDFSGCEAYPDEGTVKLSMQLSSEMPPREEPNESDSSELIEQIDISENAEEPGATEETAETGGSDTENEPEANGETGAVAAPETIRETGAEEKPVSADGSGAAEELETTEQSEEIEQPETAGEAETPAEPEADKTADTPAEPEEDIIPTNISEVSENAELNGETVLPEAEQDMEQDEMPALPKGSRATVPETETRETEGEARIELARETRYTLAAEPAEGEYVCLKMSQLPSPGFDVIHDKLSEALVFKPETELPDGAVLIVGEYGYPYIGGYFIVPFPDGAPEELIVCFDAGSVPPGRYRFEVRRMLSRTSIPEACLNGTQAAETVFELIEPEVSVSDTGDTVMPDGSGSGS